MRHDAEGLTKQWIETFGESPAIIDPELMRALIADLGGDRDEARAT